MSGLSILIKEHDDNSGTSCVGTFSSQKWHIMCRVRPQTYTYIF